MSHVPFAASRALFALIAAAMKLPLSERLAAMAQLNAYKSRGHGEGLPGNKHSRHAVAQDRRSAAKARRQLKAKSHIHR